MKAFHLLLDILGGQSGVATVCGVSPQAVFKWKTAGIPVGQCHVLECATSGRIVCEHLRDDIAWVRVPDPDWPHHPSGRPAVDHAKKTAKREAR